MEVEAAVVGNDGGGKSNGESGRRCRLRSPTMTTVEAAVLGNGR
ncbi:hypothetical protein LOK49_LG01G04126 [Camellia lanceoleosa]|uniref:Uncharacterized protein n=1 Tax=Camellia lanceoleosa TaxID=1840588 RepID=A0ACC0IXP7_9ERIC|nr:hypothetical protein LOK49_LG01G04126 [Camellia lanceoleosa]